MMITIHGLPVTTKYQDLKILIKQQCNISDFILDSLVNDGDGSKKVRVGLADDSEGSQLMKCLDGFRVAGNVLRLVPVGKSAPPNQPSTFDIRGNYQARNDFPSHGINDPSNIRSMDGRPSPWSSSSQWTPNQPVQLQPQPQNTYNFQQPIATPYGQQVPVKPFEPRDNIPVGHGSQPSQAYGIAPKSNLINLGPQRNMPTNSIRVIPEASLRQPQSDRYPSQQNYNMPQDKPMTIMKDNFQGPSQYNTAAMQDQRSGNFQPQIQPWSSQQKPFEKSHPKGIEKKYIDDRKYPESRRELKSLPEAILKPDMYKRYEDKGNRDMSPHGRPYIRNESPQRHISLTDRPVSHTSRNMSPERMRRVSPTRQVPFPDRDPSGRGVSPSRRALHGDRRYSPTERMPPMDRRISPPGRNIPHEDRRISPSGRHIPRGERRISPPGRNIPRGDRRVSPMERNIPRGDRPISPSGRHIPRGERRISPPGRNVPRGDRRVSPPGRNIPRGDGRISPSGRNIPHVDRRMSPSGRHILHEKRDSPMDRHNMPPERRISPHSRQYSPSGRMIPPERKISPSRKEEYMRGRRVSPKHAPVDRLPGRQSPPRDSARRLSPRTRQESPRRQAPRFSPRRHAEKAMDYQDGHRPIKDVRPAYENPQASKEARYASGYHPSVHEDVQYPLPRQNPWQEREKDFPSKTLNEDRRDMRQQKFEASRSSVPEHVMQVEAKRSKSRASRSPRRDRSPGRDKYRRHSPSPRSPRRSWALEKRRSPEPREPPPPPSWPGQNEYENRSKFPDREKNTIPVWESEERNKKRDDFPSRDAARRDFDEPKRRPETSKWKPVAADDQQPSSSRYMDDDRYRRDPKYPKKDFEAVRSRDFDREEDRKPHPDRRDREFVRDRDDTRYKPELKREDTIRIEEKKKEILMKQEQLQKEIDEVYKRAVDFAKKAEIYKKGEQKKDPGYDQEHRRSDRTYDRYEDDRRSRDDIRMEHPKDADAFKKFKILPAIKAKRQKACDEISEKLMCKYASNISSEYHKRIREEINKTLDKIMMEMFGDKDVSFIEIVVKFNAKHTAKDEQRIFEDVMSSLPSQFRTVKRSAQDDSNIPSKSARHSDELYMSKDQQQLMSNVPQKKASHRYDVKKKPAPVPEKKRPVQISSSEKVAEKLRKDDKQKKEEPVGAEMEVDIPILDASLEDEPEEGHFELNPLMTRVLEEELQTVMIKIWQALPDEPSIPEERYVTEKLRNVASDDLRNVLGLNITKRLLNVFNPLFVKMQFSCRPESGCLTKFLDDNRIKHFKRIQRATNTFAARVGSIADFDRMCAAKVLRCGSAEVIITPCYRFAKCPEKLSSVFADEESDHENVAESVDTEKDTNAPTDKSNNTAEKAESVSGGKEVKVTDKKDNVSVQAKPVVKKENTAVQQSETDKKESAPTSEQNKSTEKKENVSALKQTTKDVKDANASINKEKPTDNKDNTVANTKPEKSDATVVSKQNETKKLTTENKKDIDKTQNTDKTPTKVQEKTNQKAVTGKKIIAESSKTKANKLEIPPIDIDVEQEFDDGDEMDDEEILALISGGVVLDECSGSEEE